MNATTIGIGLAKNLFSVHGVEAHGRVVLKKTVSRGKLLECFVNLPPCVIGMEACSGTHHWVRQLRSLGHEARIIAPRFVIPYRKSGKNDGNDAEAICEAVSRPAMRFVPVKSVEQQAVLSLHRIRSAVVADRTAQLNQIRGQPLGANSMGSTHALPLAGLRHAWLRPGECRPPCRLWRIRRLLLPMNLS